MSGSIVCGWVVVVTALVPALARASAGDGVWRAVGTIHPILIHFPVALILTACLAEGLLILRRQPWFGDAARFMIIAAAWVSVVAAVAGFALASAMSFDPELQRAFAIHRVAGVATPVLAFLAAGLAESARRTGQVWELFLYRIVLVLAAVAVIAAGWNGGLLVYGTEFFLW